MDSNPLRLHRPAFSPAKYQLPEFVAVEFDCTKIVSYRRQETPDAFERRDWLLRKSFKNLSRVWLYEWIWKRRSTFWLNWSNFIFENMSISVCLNCNRYFYTNFAYARARFSTLFGLRRIQQSKIQIFILQWLTWVSFAVYDCFTTYFGSMYFLLIFSHTHFTFLNEWHFATFSLRSETNYTIGGNRWCPYITTLQNQIWLMFQIQILFTDPTKPQVSVLFSGTDPELLWGALIPRGGAPTQYFSNIFWKTLWN